MRSRTGQRTRALVARTNGGLPVRGLLVALLAFACPAVASDMPAIDLCTTSGLSLADRIAGLEAAGFRPIPADRMDDMIAAVALTMSFSGNISDAELTERGPLLYLERKEMAAGWLALSAQDGTGAAMIGDGDTLVFVSQLDQTDIRTFGCTIAFPDEAIDVIDAADPPAPRSFRGYPHGAVLTHRGPLSNWPGQSGAGEATYLKITAYSDLLSLIDPNWPAWPDPMLFVATSFVERVSP